MEDPRESGFHDAERERTFVARGRYLTERVATELGPKTTVAFFHSGEAGTTDGAAIKRARDVTAAVKGASDERLMRDAASRNVAPILMLSALAAAGGGLAFSHGLVFVIAACIVASIIRPRGFPLYAVAAFVPTLISVLRADVTATPFLKMLLPCFTSGLVVWLVRGRFPESEDKAARSRRRSTVFWFGLLTLFPLYPVAKMAWADLQTQRFCATVKKGDSITGLLERAASYGLTVWNDKPMDVEGTHRPAEITAMEGWAFGRYFCGVEHDGKHATKVSHTFLD